MNGFGPPWRGLARIQALESSSQSINGFGPRCGLAEYTSFGSLNPINEWLRPPRRVSRVYKPLGAHLNQHLFQGVDIENWCKVI